MAFPMDRNSRMSALKATPPPSAAPCDPQDDQGAADDPGETGGCHLNYDQLQELVTTGNTQDSSGYPVTADIQAPDASASAAPPPSGPPPMAPSGT